MRPELAARLHQIIKGESVSENGVAGVADVAAVARYASKSLELRQLRPLRVENGNLGKGASGGVTGDVAGRSQADEAAIIERAGMAADSLMIPAKSLPGPFIESWHERAAHLEYDAGLPRAWAEHLAKLIVGGPPGDFSPTRWQSVLDAALRFADCWAKEAHRLGWGLSDVFGLHETHPAARFDQRGLAWLLGDGLQVVAIDVDGADIIGPTGGRQRYYLHRAVHGAYVETSPL